MGEARTKSSFAKGRCRDLKPAFGLEEWDEEKVRFVPTLNREPSPRERAVLSGDTRHLPLDFHSWRRAYNQALADGGVKAQQAQALAGHSTIAAHEKYLRSSTTPRPSPSRHNPWPPSLAAAIEDDDVDEEPDPAVDTLVDAETRQIRFCPRCPRGL